MTGTRMVALNGSERPNGSTGACLARAAARLAERGGTLETINLADHDIKPCGCGRCNSRPDPCPVNDDVVSIVARMEMAEAIIYAAPVHGFGLASVMQLFIERAGVGCLRFNRPLTNRVGGAVVVGRRYSHAMVHAQLVENLMLNRMIMVGSGFPALIHVAGPGGVDDDIEGLDAMYRMVDRMDEMCCALRGSSYQAGRPESVELRAGSIA